MPHCVIEYSKPIEDKISPSDLCKIVHGGALDSGLFNEGDIKVRAQSFDTYLIGGKKEDFIHVTIHLLSGRDENTKKSLTSGITKSLMALNLPVKCLSAYATDVDRAVYSKINA